MRILVIEDEVKVTRFLERGLREEKFVVAVSHDGLDGLHRARTGAFDLVVLDVMLPSLNGFEILKRLKSERITARVLMLTARDEISDRVRGLEDGADDYLVKPFAFAEFLARVRALLRRTGDDFERLLQFADLTLNPRSRKVRRAGKAVSLTTREFAVLEYLMQRPGEVITRTRLAEAVWDENFESFSNVIDVTIYHLREKVDREFDPPLIHTIRGSGYTLSTEDPSTA